MPSSHLILCHPLLLLPPVPPSIRVFSNESTLRMRWPKYWSFSFSISPSSEHPGLISFRMDWLDLLAVQGTLKSLLQHHSSKASLLQRSAFFTVQLSHPYMTTGKTIEISNVYKICVTVKTESPALGLTSLDSRQSAEATTYSITNMIISETESRSVVSNSLRPHGLYSLWNSPGQNTGVGSLSLLWGIFPTQGFNPSLPHCRRILYQLIYQGSPFLFSYILI